MPSTGPTGTGPTFEHIDGVGVIPADYYNDNHSTLLPPGTLVRASEHDEIHQVSYDEPTDETPTRAAELFDDEQSTLEEKKVTSDAGLTGFAKEKTWGAAETVQSTAQGAAQTVQNVAADAKNRFTGGA